MLKRGAGPRKPSGRIGKHARIKADLRKIRKPFPDADTLIARAPIARVVNSPQASGSNGLLKIGLGKIEKGPEDPDAAPHLTHWRHGRKPIHPAASGKSHQKGFRLIPLMVCHQQILKSFSPAPPQ